MSLRKLGSKQLTHHELCTACIFTVNFSATAAHRRS